MADVLKVEGAPVKPQGEIKGEIGGLVRKLGTYKGWIIGVTDEPDHLREVYGCNDIHFWKTDSEIEARNIKDHFVSLGMHSHCNDDTDSGGWVFVY